MKKGAVISDCGKYRYKLWRIWDDTKPKILWIMHNPSTADGDHDDPTIRRIINFSKSWGFGGLYVGNIYPYRATNPKDLLMLSLLEACPIENASNVYQMRIECSMIIAAFGNPVLKTPGHFIFDKGYHALKLTNSGNPCHPLYLKADLVPQEWHS